ncbi:DUF6090 family protein [Winogradskyella aquimaris]|nr:DUF6090 family protein [Winogradskyella aquimaris]
MIKFFRHIRQSLIMNNKTSKYFKYAIGEIILVMIGILLALQVNNWNEERKHHKSEKEFYKGIAYDLNQDLEFIRYVRSYTEPKLNVFKRLNTQFPNDYGKNKTKIDSLLGIYLFSGQRTFYPVSGSFKSALAGNEINTYSQKNLIQDIIKLYGSFYDRLIDNGKIIDERWGKLSETYIHNRRVNSFEDINNSNYISLLDDFHFHYIQLNWYYNLLNETETEIMKLLKKLK